MTSPKLAPLQNEASSREPPDGSNPTSRSPARTTQDGSQIPGLLNVHDSFSAPAPAPQVSESTDPPGVLYCHGVRRTSSSPRAGFTPEKLPQVLSTVSSPSPVQSNRHPHFRPLQNISIRFKSPMESCAGKVIRAHTLESTENPRKPNTGGPRPFSHARHIPPIPRIPWRSALSNIHADHRDRTVFLPGAHT